MLKLSLLRHSVRDLPANGESRESLDYALEYSGAQADIAEVILE